MGRLGQSPVFACAAGTAAHNPAATANGKAKFFTALMSLNVPLLLDPRLLDIGIDIVVSLVVAPPVDG
jgi:hypothetical protein